MFFWTEYYILYFFNYLSDNDTVKRRVKLKISKKTIPQRLIKRHVNKHYNISPKLNDVTKVT